MANKTKKKSRSKVEHDDDNDGDDYYRYYNSDDDEKDCKRTFSESMTKSYSTANEVSSQETPIYDTTTSSQQRQQQPKNIENNKELSLKKYQIKTLHAKTSSNRAANIKGDVVSSSSSSSSSSPLSSSYDSDSSRSSNNNNNTKKKKKKTTTTANQNYIQFVPNTLRWKVSNAIQQRIQCYKIISIICGIAAVGIILSIAVLLTRPISFEEPSFWYNCSYVVSNVGLDWNYISQTSPCSSSKTPGSDTTLCTYSSHTIYLYCPLLSTTSFGLSLSNHRNRNSGHYYTYRAQYGDSYGVWERYDTNDGVLPAIWEDSDNCDELYGMMDGAWYVACQEIGYFNDDDDDDEHDYYYNDRNNDNKNNINNNDATTTTRATCIRNQYDGIVSCDGTKEDLQLDSDGKFYPI